MWNEKTVLPEVYKLTSPDSCNKNKVKIHKDSGLYGVEFTVDKTIPNFNKAAKKVNLDYACAFIKFKNVLEGMLDLAWKYVFKERFPEPVGNSAGNLSPESNQNSMENFQRAIELFLQRSTHEKKLRDRQLIYYQPGGDFQVQKDLVTLAIEHRHRFDELFFVADLLPAGDIEMPNKSLALEWFYMAFHKSKRNQFVASGQQLVDETIESVTKYFELLYNIEKSSGKLKLKLEQRDRKKFDFQRGAAKSRYNNKMRYMADGCRTSPSHDYCNDCNCNHGYKPSCDNGYNCNRPEQKAPPEFTGSPCHVHGNKAKHTYEECHDNPKNCKPSSSSHDNNNNNNRNCSYKAHYHDARYHSSDDESPGKHCTPEPSDGQTKSSKSNVNQHDEKNYHIDTGKISYQIKRRMVDVVQRSKPHKRDIFQPEKPSHSMKHPTCSLLQDELNTDKCLMELKKEFGDHDVTDDAMNLFTFDN
jgi:hypothetical protein